MYYKNILSPSVTLPQTPKSPEPISMEFGPIDGQTNIEDIRSLSDIENNPEGDTATNANQPKWRAASGKALDFALSSTTMFRYKDMDFKLHGFLVAMVAIDLLVSIMRNIFDPFSLFAHIPYVLFRNIALFVAVLSCALLRIKIFTSISQIVHQQGILSMNSDDEKEDDSDDETLGPLGRSRRDSIAVKSVVVTYLGGLVELKQMSTDRKKQMFWFLFPAIFHGALAAVFLIAAFRNEGGGYYEDEMNVRNLYLWLGKSMVWCLTMTLLPVPGFDGAALLTLFLKGRGWNKVAIAFVLVFVAAVVTFTCGIIGVFTFDILALYLAVFCGFRLIRYAFNPEDENMKVLRAMAKTTKKMTAADIV